MPSLAQKMNSKLETWATAELTKLTSFLNLSPTDIQAIITQAIDLSDAERYEYFYGILGDEALGFIQEWNDILKPKTQLQGIWKTTGMDLETQLKTNLKISDVEVEEILNTAEKMGLDERKEYFKGLMGPGFETERFFILFNKLVEKKQTDLKLSKQHQPAVQSKASKKKKKKLESEQQALGQIGSLKPRINNLAICQCMASVHLLLCNCLHCGKILCAFEGDELCCWCGKPPRDFNTDNPAAFESASLRAKTLIDYQTNSAQRTHVYDNAADFDIGNDQFNKWVSAEEREIAVQRLQEKEALETQSKSRRVMTLDLVNNKVTYQTPPPAEMKTKVKEKDVEVIDAKSSGMFRNPYIEKTRAPVFIQRITADSSNRKSKSNSEYGLDDVKRLEDAITDLEV
jgi:hypothetical protein